MPALHILAKHSIRCDAHLTQAAMISNDCASLPLTLSTHKWAVLATTLDLHHLTNHQFKQGRCC